MTDRSPRVGVSLACMDPLDILSLAQEAEQAGLYFVSVPDYAEDTFSVLAAIAATTSRIRLVSGLATWTRSPVTTARACRSLHLLSGGRYILGLGSMPRRWSEDFHGVSAEAPLSRLREYVELVRILWEATPDDPVNFSGRFYSVSGYRVPQEPVGQHLPVFIGATRRRMIRETGEWADGLLLNWNVTLPWLKEQVMPALAEGAARAGRSLDGFETVSLTSVLIADGPGEAEAARTAIRLHLAAAYLGIDYHQELLTRMGFGEEVAAAAARLASGDQDGAARAVSDPMLEALTIVGDEGECRRRVSEYTSLGSWFTLFPPVLGMETSDRVRALRRLIQAFGYDGRG